MAKKMKKSLSLLLVMSMMFNMLTVGAYATPVEGAADNDIVVVEQQTGENNDGAVVEDNGEVNNEEPVVEPAVKFSAWVSSLLKDGVTTTTVKGTVDENYNAKLVLPNAVVNAGSVTVGVAMKDIASMGIDELRQHEVTVNTGLNTEANLPDTLAGLGAPALFDFDGATVTALIKADGDAEVVTYTLEGSEFTGDEAEKVITGTTDAAEARAAWQLMVNKDNFEIATKAANDSYIVIANGSTLQLGKEVLSFEKEGDLKLDNFQNLTPADIKAMVKLDTANEAAVTFTLKKGTELAVSNSYAKLNKDVTVTVEGVEGIDGLTMLSDLRENSEDVKGLLLGLIGCMDKTVELIDAAGEVGVTIEFAEEEEPVVEPAVKFSAWVSSLLKDGVTITTVKGTVDENYNAKLVLPNAVVNAGNVTVGVAMKDIASMGIGELRQHEVTVNTGLNTEANLPDTLAGLGAPALFDFADATVNATIKANGAEKAVTYTLTGTEFAGDEAEKVITGTTDTAAARAAWQLMVNKDNFEIATKAANDSYIVIANGSTLQLGKEVLSFEKEGDLKLDNFQALNPADIKAMVKLDTVDTPAVTFTLKKGTELAVSNSYAKLNKDVTVTVEGVNGIDELTMLSDLRANSEDVKSLLLGLIGCMDKTVALIDAADAIDVTIEFAEEEHVHSLTHYEGKAATCTTNGYAEYWVCGECHKLFADANAENETTLGGLIINMTGHDWDYANPVWTWNEDNSEATVTVVCTKNEGHQISATVETTVENTPSDCDNDGNNKFTAKAVVNGHEFTATKDVVIDKTGHTAGEAARENEVPATCVAGGSYDMVVRCTVCEAVISSEHFTTEATGHTYGEPVWTWNADHTEAVAAITCANCAESTEGKILTATATGDQITNAVTKEATRREPGERTYTATVTLNGVEITGTATVEIPRRTGGGGGSSATTPVTPPTEITEPDVPLAETPMTFDDVKENDWFYNAVKYAYDNDLMKGDSATKFAPNNNTTRGMIALILYRMEKEPKAEGAGFPDVAANSWYKDAATWAVSVNVFKGYEDGTFRGDQVITREELAAVMYRYAEMKQYDVTAAAELTNFADGATVAEWAAATMKWAAATGLVTGREGNTIAPQDNATRAELATIMQRFADKVVPAAADKADATKAEDTKTETK